jgi:hypothetical protein
MLLFPIYHFYKLQNLVAGEDFTDKSGLLRYNILPLHPKFSQRPIMLLPEVRQFSTQCIFFLKYAGGLHIIAFTKKILY